MLLEGALITGFGYGVHRGLNTRPLDSKERLMDLIFSFGLGGIIMLYILWGAYHIVPHPETFFDELPFGRSTEIAAKFTVKYTLPAVVAGLVTGFVFKKMR